MVIRSAYLVSLSLVVELGGVQMNGSKPEKGKNNASRMNISAQFMSLYSLGSQLRNQFYLEGTGLSLQLT